MALVWIPPLLRDLTTGKDTASVSGANVGEIIDSLDQQFPGIRARLCPDGSLRPGLAAVVDGVVARLGLRESTNPDSEIHFLPAIAGG